MKFKVNDRVRVISTVYNAKNAVIGDTGKIVHIKPYTATSLNYLVEFDKPRSSYHNGWSSGKEHKNNHCYWCNEKMLELINEKPIVIYRNGNEVIALDKNTNKKGVAKCSPSDEFDFETGAKLAFERLVGKEKFVPHLYFMNLHYGNIGEPTNYKDAVGQTLCIGDTVDLYTNGKLIGERSIVKTENKAFVMGIERGCNEETGTIEAGWGIIKKRSFTEIKNGELVDDIEYITKEG